MTHPLVSVIMPAYNTEKYIVEAIESIIAQTYTNWELIIVNDGSTDRTGEIAEEYARRDTRIKVYHQENKGAPAARNQGLIEAKGKYIKYLDSDDILMANCLEKQVCAMKNNPRLSFVYGDAFLFVKYKSNIRTVGPPIGIGRTSDLVEAMLLGGWNANFSYLFKQTLVREVGNWNLFMRSSQDYEYALRSALYAEAYEYVPMITGQTRQHSGFRVHKTKQDKQTDPVISFLKNMSELMHIKKCATQSRMKALAFLIIKNGCEHNDRASLRKAINIALSIYPKYKYNNAIIRFVSKIIGVERTEWYFYKIRTVRNLFRNHLTVMMGVEKAEYIFGLRRSLIRYINSYISISNKNSV